MSVRPLLATLVVGAVLSVPGVPLHGQTVFGPPADALALERPVGSAHVTADLDQDGLLDIVSSGVFLPCVVLMQQPGGGYEQLMPLGSARVLAAAELTGDGLPDLVVTVVNACLLAPGLGDGTFDTLVPLPVFTGVGFARSIDLDGDGILELLAASTDKIQVLHATEEGGFVLQQTLSLDSPSVFGWVASLATGDLDEDGLIDLVVGRTLSASVWFAGAPGASFAPVMDDFDFVPGTLKAALGDVNADGDADLLWTDAAGLRVRLAQAGVQFQPAQLTSLAGLALLALEDMNADGTLDAIGLQPASGTLWVLAGLGNGRFQADAQVGQMGGGQAGGGPTGSVGDSDGDGLPEVFALRAAGLAVVPNATYGPDEPFTDLGTALPGTLGAPLLIASGENLPGARFRFDLHHALPGAVPRLVGSFTQVNLPFLGGTLVPSLQFVLFLPAVDGSGHAAVSGAWPLAASGQQFTVQSWIPDAAGPQGWASTTAVQIDVP